MWFSATPPFPIRTHPPIALCFFFFFPRRLSEFNFDIFLPPSQTNGAVPAAYPEVYIDGNENVGYSRLRVGNLIVHDYYNNETFAMPETDGVHITQPVSEVLTAASLITVSSINNNPLGAPTPSDGVNPALNIHEGLIVIRTSKEVRMDSAAQLRLGAPGESTLLRGKEGLIWYEQETQAAAIIAPLGFEVGRDLSQSPPASAVRKGPTYDSESGEDDWSLGPYGRPTFIARDVEVDGCSIPEVSHRAAIVVRRGPRGAASSSEQQRGIHTRDDGLTHPS